MGDLYPPSSAPPMSATSEENNDRPKDLKEGAKPQATFLTKLYACVPAAAVLLVPH